MGNSFPGDPHASIIIYFKFYSFLNEMPPTTVLSVFVEGCNPKQFLVFSETSFPQQRDEMFSVFTTLPNVFMLVKFIKL